MMAGSNVMTKTLTILMAVPQTVLLKMEPFVMGMDLALAVLFAGTATKFSPSNVMIQTMLPLMDVPILIVS